MGATSTKLYHISKEKKKKAKYICHSCLLRVKPKNIVYCESCHTENNYVNTLEAYGLCSGCALSHENEHCLVKRGAGKERAIRRLRTEVDEQRADMDHALNEAIAQIHREHKAHKKRLDRVCALIEESARHAPGQSETTEAVERDAEEARLRTRILINRFKLVEESNELVFQANHVQLETCATPIRTSLHREISRSTRQAFHSAAVDATNELLEAVNGKVTISEFSTLAKLVRARLRCMHMCRRSGGGEGVERRRRHNAVHPVILDEAENVSPVDAYSRSADQRHDCAEMLDLLTRINGHASIDIKEYVTPCSPSLGDGLVFLLSLSPADAPALTAARSTAVNMQKFFDLKIASARYLLAVSVCAYWLQITPPTCDEYSDIRHQLTDCIDGYGYSLQFGQFPAGHPVFLALARLLIHLAGQFDQVAKSASLRRRCAKILNDSTLFDACALSAEGRAFSDRVRRECSQYMAEVWPEH